MNTTKLTQLVETVKDVFEADVARIDELTDGKGLKHGGQACLSLITDIVNTYIDTALDDIETGSEGHLAVTSLLTINKLTDLVANPDFTFNITFDQKAGFKTIAADINDRIAFVLGEAAKKH